MNQGMNTFFNNNNNQQPAATRAMASIHQQQKQPQEQGQNPPQHLQQRQQFQKSHQKSVSTSSTDLAAQYNADIHLINKYLFREVGENGHRVEKYKAHVRIVEDSRSPNQRPPVNSPPKNKKARVLILSVKTSGRMRLHKARENPDGSIQIGRTWDFDELTAIEIDHEVPTGFLLEIGKKYYWETNSPTERRVWLTSLLQDFIRYTNGKKVPELVNCSLDYFHLGALMAKYNGNSSPAVNAGSPQINTDNSPRLKNTAGSPRKRSSPAVAIASSPVPSSARSSKADPRQSSSSQLSSGTSQQYTSMIPKDIDVGNKEVRRRSGYVLPDTSESLEISKQRAHQRQASATSMEKFESLKSSSSVRTAELAEQQRLQREKLEYERFQQQKQLEAQKLAQQKLEAQKLEAQRLEAERIEAKRLEAERLEAQRLEKQRIQREEIENERQIREHEEQRLAHAQTLQTMQADNSLSRQKSVTPSVKSIEFVSHRRSLNQIEKITTGHGDDYAEGDDYDNLFSNYTDPEHEAHTAPLNIGASLLSREVNVQNDQYDDYDTSKDLDSSVTFPEIKLTSETGITSTIESIDSDDDDTENPQKESRRPHARSRAFSRLDSEANKNTDLTDLFDKIGWDPRVDDSKTLQKKLEKELERLHYEKVNALTETSEASSSLYSSINQSLDKCSKIEPILSFFGVQLSSFQEDIDYVERQGHGVQIEATNKKLLKRELNEILHSVDVTDRNLEILRSNMKLGEQNQHIEAALSELYTALLKIRGTSEGGQDDQMGNMKALDEKRAKYEDANKRFINRFKNYIPELFRSVVTSLNSKLQSSSSSLSEFADLSLPQKLSGLLTLNGPIAYLKEISPNDYYDIMNIYEREFTPVYNNLTRVMMDRFRSEKATINTIPFTFNGAPKDVLTERSNRSKSGASKSKMNASSKFFAELEELGFNTASADKSTSTKGSAEPSKEISPEIQLSSLLTSFLEDFFKIVIIQQKFIIQFFSLSSTSGSSFLESIKQPIKQRVGYFIDTETSLGNMETDRDVSDEIYNVMHNLFSESTSSIMKSMTSVSKENMLQCPTILVYLEHFTTTLSSTNQEYIVSVLNKISSKLTRVWKNDIDKQIALIDNQEIHCAVFSFTKAFPEFIRKIEAGISALEVPNYETYTTFKSLSGDYERLWNMIDMCLNKNTTLFEQPTMQPQLSRSIANYSTMSRESDQISLSSTKSNKNELIKNHLMLLMNYKWVSEEIKDLTTLPPHIRNSIGEQRSAELNSYCQLLARTKSVRELVTYIEGIEGLVESGTDPSRTNTYSVSNMRLMLSKFDASQLKSSIKELANQVSSMIIGNCVSDVKGDEDELSIDISKQIEKSLFNDCLNSLSSIYNSSFSKLNTVINKYYSQLAIERSVIGFTKVVNDSFSKEYL